jgi:cell division protein FtsB
MAVKDRDRFSTATRLRLLGEQTAARVYRSQTRRQARRSRLTSRAALLALVLCSLVVALAYPMRQYVSQRADIADLKREKQQARQRVEQLRDLKARWQDDAYAEQQIRLRLHYVMPGEQAFRVSDPPATDAGNGGPAAISPLWWNRLLASVSDAATPVEQLPTGNRHAP